MSENRPLSVGEAMGCAKQALETVRLRVIGEVSEVADKPAYSAAYFTLCDDQAAMPCLMWRDAYESAGVVLECGSLVEVSGHFSAYAKRGRLQFVVRSLELAGEGRLRMQVAALARALDGEGLMRPDRKRPLPRYPSRIAVVTSPRGKAVHDVLRTLRRRYPVAEVLLAGVPVEGADAANGLVEGLRVAAEARPEVILIVRGGGSYEDLMPFNSEALARAIALSPVPVVSGIGHEPDTTIADMVADVRASTPTAAAEAAVPDSAEMTLALEREGRLLGRALQHRVQESAHRVRLLVERPVFQQAGALLGPVAQTIDAAAQALHRSIPARLERDAQRVELARERLVRVGRRLTEPARGAVTAASAQLESLSPLAVMARGYAVMYAADGSTVVRDPQQVDVADAVVVRVALGRIDCTVTGTEGAE